ncbi:Uncharacterised protein [Mycobacteroides abscessus subsp. bolletii]|nr:Uncharacterised protein [Mycobacteroides abscessus subsp. abscessus]SIM95736.1 Uncharacterised protein [Mycobacteroides abscessus subsp. bolletii]
MLFALDDDAADRVDPKLALCRVVARHSDLIVLVFGLHTPLLGTGCHLGVLILVIQRGVGDGLHQLSVRVVADVLGEVVGGEPVDVLFAGVVGVEGALGDNVEVLVRLLLGVEGEPVAQPLVLECDRRRRRLVFDGTRLLHAAARVVVAGDRLGRMPVHGDGVDRGKDQARVTLLVGPAQSDARLQADLGGIGRTDRADLFLQRQRPVRVGNELLAG